MIRFGGTSTRTGRSVDATLRGAVGHIGVIWLCRVGPLYGKQPDLKQMVRHRFLADTGIGASSARTSLPALFPQHCLVTAAAPGPVSILDVS
jgi:hypothetical protein